MTSNRRAFTLVELLVAIAMVAVLMAALTTAVTAARERARVQKALTEVKAVSQAILAYENYNGSRGHYTLPTLNNADAEASSIGFLLGSGGSTASGDKVPVLLMAALSAGGKMRDPWGTPYKVTIRPSSRSPKITTATGALQTGFYLPNFYRLMEGEQ